MRAASVWPRLEGSPRQCVTCGSSHLRHTVLQAFWAGSGVSGGHSHSRSQNRTHGVTHVPWHHSLHLVCGSCFLSRGCQGPMNKVVEMWLSLESFVSKTSLPVSQLPGRLVPRFKNLVTETTRKISDFPISFFSHWIWGHH